MRMFIIEGVMHISEQHAMSMGAAWRQAVREVLAGAGPSVFMCRRRHRRSQVCSATFLTLNWPMPLRQALAGYRVIARHAALNEVDTQC